MADDTLALIRGTLDMLVLNALSVGEKHGYGVAEWIEAASGGRLLVEEGTLYPALHRLERRGLVSAEWGVSANNRRARYYRLTGAGKGRLAREAEAWRSYAEAVGRTLAEGGAP